MKKLIVIAGPTASGKTALAIDIASYFNTEILSADSRQCFRELNIGVAKPTFEELQKVKHHFINSHSIHEEMNAGIYERFAIDALDEIFKHHDIAVCVGGTGMYLQALCDGLDEMPNIDKTISDDINQQYAEKGLLWLQEEIKYLDPLFYEKGEMQNPARLLRALSFIKSCGSSILLFQNKKIKPRNFDIYRFSIDMERTLLYQRIDHRVDQMIESGLLEEVKKLYHFRQFNSLNTVGYKELFDYFDNIYPLDIAIEKIKQHSRNYAKRQVTWFKNQGNYEQSAASEILANALKIK